MTEVRIAIPSVLPGGLEASLGAHFGHCDLYTVVEVKDGSIAGVSTLSCPPHEKGGCLATVNHLAQNGITVLVAGAIGMRPLMGFNQVGIDVFQGSNASTVNAAVQALLRNELLPFTREFACGGGHAHHGQGHNHAEN